MKIIYRYPSKIERELSHIKSFISLFNDFKILDWKRKNPPCPDFVINTKDLIIGLEVTTIMHEKSNNPSLASIRAAQNKCFIKAQKLAESSNIPPLDVKAKFVSDSRFVDADFAAKELYNFVVNKLPDIPEQGVLDIKNKELTYFDWIRIRRSEENDWYRLHVYVSKINPTEEISKALANKQAKYSEYLNCCDKCWLLIGIDEWTAPEAFNVNEDLDFTFKCDFERVFFLHNITDKLVELKIEK